MSLLNITPVNFENALICIATNKDTENGLQQYIDNYEEVYLTKMLGCDLYKLFIADLVNGVPQTQIYIDIYEKFCYDEDGCGTQIKSEGMVKMLEKFIFFEYTRNQKVKNTNTGNIVNMNEVSREANYTETSIFQNYNEAIESNDAIQWFICDNEASYQTFNGQKTEKTSWI